MKHLSILSLLFVTLLISSCDDDVAPADPEYILVHTISSEGRISWFKASETETQLSSGLTIDGRVHQAWKSDDFLFIVTSTLDQELKMHRISLVNKTHIESVLPDYQSGFIMGPIAAANGNLFFADYNGLTSFIRVVDMETLEQKDTFNLGISFISSMVGSNGKLFMRAGAEVHVYDAETFELLSPLTLSSYPGALVVDKNGDILVVGVKIHRVDKNTLESEVVTSGFLEFPSIDEQRNVLYGLMPYAQPSLYAYALTKLNLANGSTTKLSDNISSDPRFVRYDDFTGKVIVGGSKFGASKGTVTIFTSSGEIEHSAEIAGIPVALF